MTSSKWLPNQSADAIEELYRRINGLETYTNDLERRISNFDSPQPISRVDPLTYLNPYEGQRAIDPADEQHMWYSNEKWRKAGGNPTFAIKVFEDDKSNIVKSRAFVWEVPEDLDGGKIVRAGAFITTTGGANEIDMRHDGGASILDAHITIPAGSTSSKLGHTATCNTDVAWGDLFAIDTVAASGKGLGVWFILTNVNVGGAIIKGAKGDPGGITNWTGAYNNTTTYHVGDAVSSGGNSYVALTTVIGVTPGVTPGWQTSWMLLSTGVTESSFGLTVAAGTYNIQPGIKGTTGKMPFGGTIEEVSLFADKAGDATVDIWKSTFSGYLPTSANSITGGSPPALGGAIKTTNTTLTGWTTAFNKDDIFVFYIPSVALTVGFVGVTLKVIRA